MIMNEKDIITAKTHVKKIGNYILGPPLGGGAFSEVRIATHVPTNVAVAMKIIKKDKLQHEYDLQRVLTEIRVLKLMKHPNIITFLEVIDSKNNIYLSTELAKGGQLLEYIQKQQKLSEQEACYFFRQIVNAVHYCHLRRVCHRDLKLENILLTDQNTLKIVDFGLSYVFEATIQMNTSCGSAHYMSPEVVKKIPYNGVANDVWACGIILFIMICGYFPFDDPEIGGLFTKIITCNLRIPDHVSASARNLMVKLLTKKANDRISLTDVMQHEWFLTACNEQFTPTFDVNIRPSLDFRIIAKMVHALGYDPLEIVTDLQQDQYTKLTATYYLLCERRPYQPDQNEQWAAQLGFTQIADGTYVQNSIASTPLTQTTSNLFSSMPQSLQSEYGKVCATMSRQQSVDRLGALEKVDEENEQACQDDAQEKKDE